MKCGLFFSLLLVLTTIACAAKEEQKEEEGVVNSPKDDKRQGRRLVRKKILKKKADLSQYEPFTPSYNVDGGHVHGNHQGGIITTLQQLSQQSDYQNNLTEDDGEQSYYITGSVFNDTVGLGHYQTTGTTSFYVPHSPTYPHPSPSTELGIPKPRQERILGSLIRGAKTTLKWAVTVNIPIPFCEFPNAPCTTMDIDIPFAYELPTSNSGRSITARKLEDEHAAVLEMAEDMLSKFGINGKACVMRLICELAESRGLPYNGLLGKALETLFLLDYGYSSTERLFDYISARSYGEHEGDCHVVYPQCPFSAFNLLDSSFLHNEVNP